MFELINPSPEEEQSDIRNLTAIDDIRFGLDNLIK